MPGFSVLDWQGLFHHCTYARPTIVNKLNAEAVRILALPDVVDEARRCRRGNTNVDTPK